MAMYWDKERVAVEIIDDEKNAEQDKYPKGTLVFYVGASQVADDDLLDCLRRLVIERGLRASMQSDPKGCDSSEDDGKLWAAELELAHNLMGDNDKQDLGNNDSCDNLDDRDIDLKLEEYMAGLGMLRDYPYTADDLAAKQVIIHDCEHVSID